MGSVYDEAYTDRPSRLPEGWNLSRNPFHKDPPGDELIDETFVGRKAEMLRVGDAFWDLPRNVMIRGGYGMGKTTFAKKILRELAITQSRKFLVSYEALAGDRPIDFLHAVLKALSAALRVTHAEAEGIYKGLLDNERYDHPDLHIRHLIEHANAEYDRIVVVIDELEKRPNRTIQEIIIQGRPIFDLPCSFLIPGRLLDAMSHVDSSAFGVFIDTIDLEPFNHEDSLEILRRNLFHARAYAAEEMSPIHPFADDVAERLISDARGIPRVIHAIAFSLLLGALADTLKRGEPVSIIDMDAYKKYLYLAGAEVYAGTDQRAREVIRTLGRHGGYVDLRNLDEFLDDKFPLDANLEIVEDLTHNDLLIKAESAVSVHYALSAPVDSYLQEELLQKEEMRSLWQKAQDKSNTSQERGSFLENFASNLFGRVFNVVHQNLNTETEELDLVLEYRRGSARIWAEAQRSVVECKNWSSALPQKEISATGMKATLDNFRLVFFVSVSGFTRDARYQAERIRQKHRLSLVLIGGSDIEEFLADDETVDDFLQGMHRNAQLNVR